MTRMNMSSTEIMSKERFPAVRSVSSTRTCTGPLSDGGSAKDWY